MVQPVNANTVSQTNNAVQQPAKRTLKDGIADIAKGFNNLSYPVQGAIKGTTQGIAAAALVGLVGKNITKSQGKIAGTIGGVLKDAGSVVLNTVKKVPDLITKAPLENAKSLCGLPKKFYTKYLAGNKLTAAIATGVGLLFLAGNIIHSRIKANQANADIDHKFGIRH